MPRGTAFADENIIMTGGTTHALTGSSYGAGTLRKASGALLSVVGGWISLRLTGDAADPSNGHHLREGQSIMLVSGEIQNASIHAIENSGIHVTYMR